MDQQTLIALASAIFAAGTVYGVLNTRLMTVEEKQTKHDDHAERLIRLETKLDILINHISKED